MKPSRTLTLIGALALAAALAAAPALAAPTLKQQVAAQKLTIANLSIKLDQMKARDAKKIAALKAQIATANSDLATRTTERDTATTSLATATASLAAQQALTTQAAAGSFAGLSGDQLWEVVRALYPLFPSTGLCGYDRTLFVSGSYASYEFTRGGC